jgi:hypothetical protein
MGVEFHCLETEFGCSYGSWNKIRTSIIKSTFEYIQNKFENDKELHKDVDDKEDEDYIGEGSSYYLYMTLIQKFIDISITKQSFQSIFDVEIDNIINKLLIYCHKLQFIDALNYFDIGGVFALCNKNDFQGYYTPGNSLDICSLLDKIKPFTKPYEIYDCIYIEESRDTACIYNLFKESVVSLTKISIR